MSKKGRSSVILLSLVVSALMLVPLIYFALAAKFEPIDQDALNNRIAELEDTAVKSPTDLQAFYRDIQLVLLSDLSPGGSVTDNFGVVVFDPDDFAGWLDALEPAELNKVTVYPITVTEDFETRETVFLNSLGQEIDRILPEQRYDPFTLLATWKLDLFIEYAEPEDQAWYMDVYNPARISITFYLLPADSVEDMAMVQLTTEAQEEVPEMPDMFDMQMMMGEGMAEPVSNLVIFAIESVSNGIALGIGWPDDFTNNLEVFARTTPAPTGWYVLSTNLFTAGTNSLWWVDTTISSNTGSRFYRAGNADLDSDDDGLTDARELMIYGTDGSEADSDGDGLVDGYSGVVSTNAYPTGAHTNGGAYIEGELNWGTDTRVSDTDDDGMGDGWEVANGHDPLDPDDPPNVSGTISYYGGQTGTIWVVAVTSSNSWSTNNCAVLTAPGAYRIPNLTATNYWLKAWMDSIGNGVTNAIEPWGVFTNNPVSVTNRLVGQDITLTDPDSDSDGLPDWWEIARFGSITNWAGTADPDGDQYTNLEEYQADTDPTNSVSHPWNISGTISYNGPQTGMIYIVASTSATEWDGVQYVALATPGAYVFTHLPPDRDYWIRAWRDAHGNEAPDFWEAWGEYPDNPVSLTANAGAVNVTLTDHDSDGDSLPDWWEVLYGFDPMNGGGDNAIAWWKLDATAGTNVQDSTSHTNHSVLLNAGANSWTSGVIGNALVFDGIDDYVQIADSDTLKPEFVSVALWVKPSRNYTNGSVVFFSKKATGATGYRLSYEQGALSFLVCASGEKTVSLTCNLDSNVWHHVAGTYGGSSQRLYVDGILVAQTDYNWGMAFGYIDQGTTNPRIGASPDTTASNLFAGVIDDVHLYADELTSNQVFGIYQTGSDEDADGLSAWQEYQVGTSPTNADTDGDGLWDGDELTLGTDPSVADTDRDGFNDGADSNATSRVFIKWGDPRFTSGDTYYYRGPAWFVSAYKLTGEFLHNPPYGWLGKAAGPKEGMAFILGGTNSGHNPSSSGSPEYYSISCNPLYLDRTEVTKAKWDQVRNWGLTNGYTDIGYGAGKETNHPVQSVSWYASVKWCNARSEMEGLQPAYYTSSNRTTVYRSGAIVLDENCVKPNGGYRLPTAMEWEYAGRGGLSSMRYAWGNTISHAQANYFSRDLYSYDVSPTRGYHPSYASSPTPYTSPVGSFQSNGFGLCDMMGNIREWVWNIETNAFLYRGHKGGSCYADANSCIISWPEFASPELTYDDIGFRTILNPHAGLVIAVDRQALTNDVVMEMDFLDQTNTSLYVGLANANHIFISSNLVGNLSSGSGAGKSVKFDIPFESFSDATEIHIWSDRGEVTVFTNRLYIDRDHDGWDAEQEEQLGTSDNPDTDGDGLLDFAEEKGESGFNQLITNSACWEEAGTGAVFITQWPGVVGGRVEAAYSPPISFPVVLGTYTGSTVRVAADGYLVVDAGYPSNTPSAGINLPESNLCVAVFWDDLSISASTGVWVKTSGSGVTARLTVAWCGVETKTPGQGLDYQCVYSVSNRGFVFNYRNTAGKSFPSSGYYTVGVWGNGLMPKSRIAFNQTGFQIASGMSVSITPAITDPFNPDTDGDGGTDAQEAFWGFSPASSNAPTEDWDGDGSSLAQELAAGTDPTLPDTDLDGFIDGEDADPLVLSLPTEHSDEDGLSDWLEMAYGSCVTNIDTDADGVNDYTEVMQGSDPADNSDAGAIPEETVQVALTLATYDYGNPARARGTALYLGGISHRIPILQGQQYVAQRTELAEMNGPLLEEESLLNGVETWSDTEYAMTYRLARGKAYDLTLMSMPGNVEAQSIFSSITMEGVDSAWGWTGNSLNLGSSVLEYPGQAFGWWDYILVPTNHAVLKIPSIHIAWQGTVITEHFGHRHDQVSLSAVVAPEMAGTIHWTCDISPSMLSTTSGSNVVVTLESEALVTAEFLPTGAAIGVSATVSLRIQDHIHQWGSMGMSLPPFIRLNDNDSNNNGIPDRNEGLSSSSDTNIVSVVFSLQEQPDMLACCMTNYPKPWIISLVNSSGGDKVRNIGGANSTLIVSNAPPEHSPWSFEVEGTNCSGAVNDVAYEGRINFANGVSERSTSLTTIGKPTLGLGIHPTSQCLLLNEDDDNGNGTSDNLEIGVCTDDELLEIPAYFDMEPTNLTSGTLTLYVTNGTSRVRFWADRNKSTAIQANLPRPPAQWSGSVFVEGMQRSVEPEDVSLIWAYQNGIFVTQACFRLTVVQADLDMQGVVEGKENVSWAYNYIFYNHDDDNTNCVIDVNDAGSVANEDDLKKISLKAGPASLTDGFYVLEKQGSNLRVWEGSNRTGPVTLPKVWAANAWVNIDLWVEGLFPGTDENTLTFRYTNSVSSLADNLKIYDLGLELVLDGTSDGEEELVGGLLAFNRDDDNSNGMPDYLDSGEDGLYDYDLGSIELLGNYYGLTNGILKFEVLEGGERVRLWESWGWPGECAKEVQMPLTNEWNMASQWPPEAASIEGLSKSSAPRDVVLRLSYSNESFYAQDIVKITGVDVNITQTNLENYVYNTNCTPFNLSADSWTNVIWTISPNLGTNGAQFSTGTVWTGTGTNAWQGTNVWVYSGPVTNLYTLTARAAELSRCCDTATLTVLKPKFVNLNWLEATNEALHNTSLYQTNALVLRRSDKFKVDLKLKGYTNTDFNVWFQAIQDFDGPPTTNVVPVVPADLSVTDWYCKLLSTSNNSDQTTTVHMEINIPSTNCPIGEYQWQALVGPTADTNIVLDSTNFPGQVIILFNPWSVNDSVFITDDDDKQEYVQNNSGILWVGTQKRDWDFDQQSEQALRLLLKLCGTNSANQRMDVTTISRILAIEVRKGDDGVLFGKWGEDNGVTYAGGKKPWEWLGSAAIVDQFLLSGNTVKYGQCWVFAGVLNTLLRAAGIPSRSVTAYEAAHDGNGDGFADCYFEKNSAGVWKCEVGEVWNFHLWCEVWTKRPDRVNADGWQVVDATYQIGPAPVSAVQGRSGGMYDVSFVVSEVYLIRRDYYKINGTFLLYKTTTNGVSSKIVTKGVNVDSSVNITGNYK